MSEACSINDGWIDERMDGRTDGWMISTSLQEAFPHPAITLCVAVTESPWPTPSPLTLPFRLYLSTSHWVKQPQSTEAEAHLGNSQLPKVPRD